MCIKRIIKVSVPQLWYNYHHNCGTTITAAVIRLSPQLWYEYFVASRQEFS